MRARPSRRDSDVPRKLALAGFVVCVGLIAFALYLQYVEKQEPCPLCMIQRLFFYAVGGVLLLAALHRPKGAGIRVYGVLAGLFAIGGAGFAARHVWLQRHPPEMEACGADLFFQLQRSPFFSVIERALYATGDCAKVDWTLLHLSIAEWSLIWFVVLAVWSLVYAMQKPRSRRGQFDWL